MSKILDVNNMLDAASDSKMPDLESHINALEYAATNLAHALAKHLRVRLKEDATYQQGFAGLCASFGPAKKNQKCPPVLDEHDEGGEWE